MSRAEILAELDEAVREARAQYQAACNVGDFEAMKRLEQRISAFLSAEDFVMGNRTT